MNILGFHKLSLVDYPEKLSSVIFTGGCNFRCAYCHNKVIVNQEAETIDEVALRKELLHRKKYVSSLCITGGEPTLQDDLVDFIHTYKKEGFNIKLDTNGSNPSVLKELLDRKLLDYVAMDLKTDIKEYERVIGKSGYEDKILKSIGLLKSASVDYEFRTTLVKDLISTKSIEGLKHMVQGSPKYVLQGVRVNEEVLCPNIKMQPYSKEEMEKLVDEFAPFTKETRLNL